MFTKPQKISIIAVHCNKQTTTHISILPRVQAYGFSKSPVELISKGPTSCKKPRIELEPGPMVDVDVDVFTVAVAVAVVAATTMKTLKT